jgi:ketosteroid isomerase-like protein
VESRAEYLAHHLAADIEFARAVASTRSDVRVAQLGDVAWVSASSRAEGELRGRKIRSAGAELMVLTRVDASWRIRAIHWSSRPLKEETPAAARASAPAAP